MQKYSIEELLDLPRLHRPVRDDVPGIMELKAPLECGAKLNMVCGLIVEHGVGAREPRLSCLFGGRLPDNAPHTDTQEAAKQHAQAVRQAIRELVRAEMVGDDVAACNAIGESLDRARAELDTARARHNAAAAGRETALAAGQDVRSFRAEITAAADEVEDCTALVNQLATKFNAAHRKLTERRNELWAKHSSAALAEQLAALQVRRDALQARLDQFATEACSELLLLSFLKEALSAAK